MTDIERLTNEINAVQATYDRHVGHLQRLNRYYDECPDGDPRKTKVLADIERVSQLKNIAENHLGELIDELVAAENAES